jgi:hypothetical protein
VPVLVKVTTFLNRKGSRVNEAHVALEHVEELGQLVDARLSQEPSNWSDLRVILYFEYRAAYLIELFQFSKPLLGISDHGPELVEPEPPLVAPHPLLDKEDRPRGGELDAETDDEKERGQKEDAGEGSNDVQRPLEDEGHPPHSSGGEGDYCRPPTHIFFIHRLLQDKFHPPQTMKDFVNPRNFSL